MRSGQNSIISTAASNGRDSGAPLHSHALSQWVCKDTGFFIKTLSQRTATAGALQILSVDACTPLLLGIGTLPNIAK